MPIKKPPASVDAGGFFVGEMDLRWLSAVWVESNRLHRRLQF